MKGLIVALVAPKPAQMRVKEMKSNVENHRQVLESKEKSNEINAWRLSVAPMLDWTDAEKKPKQINRLGFFVGEPLLF